MSYRCQWPGCGAPLDSDKPACTVCSLLVVLRWMTGYYFGALPWKVKMQRGPLLGWEESP